MEKQLIGNIIRRLRKQQGISSSELARRVGVDRATIYNIENGKVNPNKETVDLILEYLYVDFEYIDIQLLNEEEAKHVKAIDEMDEYISKNDYVRAKELLKDLKMDGKFKARILNKQYIAYAEAIITKESGKDAKFKKTIAILKGIMKESIPKFNEKNIKDYYLSKSEIYILLNLANIYDEIGKYEAAIIIARGLKENFDNYCIDKNYRGKHLPKILFNLSNYLGRAGKEDEALKLCEEGIELCVVTDSYRVLPALTFNKGFFLAKEEVTKEEGINLMKRTYHTLIIHQKPEEAKKIQEYLKLEYNILLD